MNLAFEASTRSEDPYVKVGGVALRYDHSVAAVSYNGAPPGIWINWSDRDERRKRVIHCEANLLRYIRPGECYLVATTISPCSSCLKHMVAYGIRTFIYAERYDKDDFVFTLAKEFGATLKQIKRKLP